MTSACSTVVTLERRCLCAFGVGPRRAAPRRNVSPRGLLELAAVAWLALLALAGASPAAAQFYQHRRKDGSVFYSRLPVVAEDARWQGVVFPARTDRAYQRAPERTGLARRRAACELHFLEAVQLYQLPLDFLRAVAHVESGFDPSALSIDGAMGIMQLMPFTAKKMGVTEPHDARQSILGGARFLRILANQWHGDIALTVAAYNAGSGAVKKYHGIPPYAETQRYVRRVLARFESYSHERRTAPRVDIEPRPTSPGPRRREAVEVVFLTPPHERKGKNNVVR
jgi:soluble lytic murein transglycosylase-like protein